MRITSLLWWFVLVPASVWSQDSTRTRTVDTTTFFDYQVQHQASTVPGSPTPKPPAGQPHTGQTVTVMAQFVVDRDGRAVMSTFKVLKPADPAYVGAVRDALPSMRFKPATINGQSVNQLVQEPFNFKN